MQSFCDAFRRNEDGSWVCVEPATIQGPGARIDAWPGEVYTPDSELAEFLEIEDVVRMQTAETITRRRSRTQHRIRGRSPN
jgi:hypothetical protein